MKALYVALVVSIAMLFTASEGRAGFFAGQALHIACSDEDDDDVDDWGICTGYIMGVYDSRVPAPGPGTNRTQWKGGWTACVPLDVGRRDILVAVKNWLWLHSKPRWHNDSADLVAAALAETWPCPD